MKLDIIRIGNSRGVRLPKAVLEQAGVGEAVEVSVEGDSIVLKPVRETRRARSGWERAFAAASGEDEALWPPGSISSFDDKEWTW